MPRTITHEHHFYEWLETEFPSSLLSEEGQRALQDRADEIVGAIDGYFTPVYMGRSANARYLKPDIEEVREAYRENNLKRLGRALEGFKDACHYL